MAPQTDDFVHVGCLLAGPAAQSECQHHMYAHRDLLDMRGDDGEEADKMVDRILTPHTHVRTNTKCQEVGAELDVLLALGPTRITHISPLTFEESIAYIMRSGSNLSGSGKPWWQPAHRDGTTSVPADCCAHDDVT